MEPVELWSFLPVCGRVWSCVLSVRARTNRQCISLSLSPALFLFLSLSLSLPLSPSSLLHLSFISPLSLPPCILFVSLARYHRNPSISPASNVHEANLKTNSFNNLMFNDANLCSYVNGLYFKAVFFHSVTTF